MRMIKLLLILFSSVSLQWLSWSYPALAESSCHEKSLQSCVNSCTSQISSSCNSFVQTDQDLSSNAVGECCAVRGKIKRKACFRNFLELTNNKSFRQLIGNDSALKIKSDLRKAMKEQCILATTSGVLYSTSTPQSAKFYPPNITCEGDCLYPYDARSLTVRSRAYNINLNLTSCSGYLLIYAGEFDASAATDNLFFYGSAEALSETSFNVSLSSETPYIIVVYPSAPINNCEYTLTLTTD